MKQPEATEGLRSGLEKLGLPAGFAQPLELYHREVEKHNARYGLVRVTHPSTLVEHILDCLAPWAHLVPRLGNRVVDLGSGAGLPGIPLALLARELASKVSWVLAERMAKRAAFLSGTLAILGLTQARVHFGNASRLEGRFDLAVCRAFLPLGKELLDLASRVLSTGGTLAYYAGKRIKAEQQLAEKFGDAAKWIRLETSPKERWLVLIPIPTEL